MKDFFKSFYQLDETEFKTLWENAIFIFDTNILLNLYRYQSTTRDGLLDVLDKLSERIWIPYHVSLEYHRNRLSVIADQYKRFSEVRSVVTNSISDMENGLNKLQLKKRHSHISSDTLLESMEKLRDEFFKELETLEKKSINISSDDPILNKLNSLFLGKVGDPFSSQKELDDLFKEGEGRYSKQIPPGFLDSDKDKDKKKSDDFTYGGLLYKRKFGDLIVWKQIISHVKDNNVKDVIFVTDDDKDDWWQTIKGKTIGLHPELINEITRDGEVDRFYAYNTGSFLKYANEQLHTKVTEETIEEVNEVAFIRRESRDRNSIIGMYKIVEQYVFNWLSKQYDNLELNHRGFPDIVAYQGEFKFGFEVKMVRRMLSLSNIIKDRLYRAYHSLKEEGFDEITIVLALFDAVDIDRAIHILHHQLSDVKGNIKVLIAHIDFDEEAGRVYDFHIVTEIRGEDY